MIKKIIKFMKEPYRFLLKLDQKRIVNLPDKLYLYYRGRSQMGIKMNIDNPKTFNEKMQWLKLYDRKKEYTIFVDKYEVREYISKMIGEEFLIPLIGVYDKFDDIDFDSLPSKFVIKCTHDSGSVVICKNKKSFDIEEARKKINKAMSINYYYAGREWPYKDVKPRIIIEKFMIDDNKKELIDYKFMCFNSEPEIVFTCTERFSEEGLKVTFFDKNWHKLDFERHYPSSKKMINKPKNYDKMLEFSKKLSKNIPFVRVDWYEINNKLYFGELTFYPGSGYEEFRPNEYDLKLGEMIDISKVRNK